MVVLFPFIFVASAENIHVFPGAQVRLFSRFCSSGFL